MHILSEHKCFDGLQLRVRHPSAVNHCEMTYSLYLPPQALAGGRVPLLYWLSGLTCTDENFTQKAGAQRYAARGRSTTTCTTTSRQNCPPTSPRTTRSMTARVSPGTAWAGTAHCKSP